MSDGDTLRPPRAPLVAVWAVDGAARAQLVRAARDAGFVVRASGRAAEHAKAMADGAVRLVVSIGATPVPVPANTPCEVLDHVDAAPARFTHWARVLGAQD